MNILRDYTFSWWQMGIFKVALLLIGIAIGSSWYEVFAPHVVPFAVVGLALGAYIGYVGFSK